MCFLSLSWFSGVWLPEGLAPSDVDCGVKSAGFAGPGPAAALPAFPPFRSTVI
jgi:hypothetical protein